MRTVSWGALLLLVAFLLAACSSATTAPADKALNSATVMEPTLKPLATLPQPVVAFTVEPTQPASSAALPAFTLATATAAPPKAGMQTEAKTAAQTSLGDEATLAATPEPTFTPPALPFTSDKDHYWLRRPIPEGGTVWTDKVYPYGSTRGGTLRPHHGVEFYVPGGTPILAAASGTVVVAGSDSETIYGPHPDFYGNLVVIELDSRYNGQPVYTLYGHLSQIFVNVGQSVNAEDILAYSGATGVDDSPGSRIG